MNGFINLSREKSKGLDLVVYSNSKNLYKDAMILSSHQSYSTASSLLILSLEECVKALYIFLYSEGIDVYKSKLAKKIFTNHAVRHDIAKSVEVLLGIVEIISKFSYSVDKFNNSSSKKTLKFIGVINSILVIVQTGNRIRNIGTFSKMKNNGFYVDYLDRIIVPHDIVGKEELHLIQEIYFRLSKNYKFLKLISDKHFLEKYFGVASEELKMKIIRALNEYLNS